MATKRSEGRTRHPKRKRRGTSAQGADAPEPAPERRPRKPRAPRAVDAPTAAARYIKARNAIRAKLAQAQAQIDALNDEALKLRAGLPPEVVTVADSIDAAMGESADE